MDGYETVRDVVLSYMFKAGKPTLSKIEKLISVLDIGHLNDLNVKCKVRGLKQIKTFVEKVLEERKGMYLKLFSSFMFR